MKALLLEAYHQLVYTDVPAPEISADEVLVQVKATGICGSDIHGMDGSSGRRQPPLIMGHESAGVIAAVGEAVAGWHVGDRVTFDSTIYCGHCHFCRRGEINLCDNRMVLGVSTGDYRRHGAFAEYVAVPQRILYRVPDALSFEVAAFVEPVAIAIHAVERARPRLNDTAVVVGAGMIGLLIVQALRAAGCSSVVAVDLNDARLRVAADFGATATLNAERDPVASVIQEMTGGRGADCAFEVVGASAPLQTAIAATRKGGSVTLVGNLAPEAALPLQAVVTREITLYGSCASQGDYPTALSLLASGAIDVRRMVSAVAPLSEGAQWFERLYHGDSDLLKVILVP